MHQLFKTSIRNQFKIKTAGSVKIRIFAALI
jgi:hypothetical protein